MALWVQKYGGTSVGSPERILAVADQIVRVRNQGHSLVVVVSAMGSSTDELIHLAHQVSNRPSLREMDMLLSTGERISMALLSMALVDRGVPAISLTGSQTGIITDSHHRRARIKNILGDRVRQGLQEQKVVIVAGFQGVSESKEITTLGRGGSDTTAVALAAELQADRCEIYTDVDGVFSADPGVVQGAIHYPRVPAGWMVEMAHRGAGVLHPRSVELAKQYQVPLWVKNSLKGRMEDQEGTEVVSEEFRVAGVAVDRSKVHLSVELMRSSVSGALWDRASEANLVILSPFFFGVRVEFFAEKEAEEEWKKILERLMSEGFAKSYEWRSGWIPLSIVGDRLVQDGAALSKVMTILGRCGISVVAGSASSLAMTVGVPESHAEEAVQALHEHLIKGVLDV